MSTWCLQDLGTKVNRKEIETLVIVTIHVHQRDIAQEVRSRKAQDVNDSNWLKQARFYWRPSSGDSNGGSTVVSITDVDFNYQYEYLGSKEHLVVSPWHTSATSPSRRRWGCTLEEHRQDPPVPVRLRRSKIWEIVSVSVLSLPTVLYRTNEVC